MKKVLIIQQMIPHYRVPVFNLLSKYCDLTLWAENGAEVGQYTFDFKKISFGSKGPFIKINNFDIKELSYFDHVIFTFNIRILDLLRLIIFRDKSYRLSLWGIGVSSEQGFDTVRKYDRLRAWMARKADSVIFYSEYPVERYVSHGVDKESIFIAHNTLDLKSKYFMNPKKHFLFVGTLKKYKKIDHFIKLYSEMVEDDPDILPLRIIGGGSYFDDLQQLVNDLSLGHKVTLHGSITDTEKLEVFYKYAVASVSPSQAGLSVLQSLAMGVPFVTKADAITGGERLNIIDGYNGYLAEDDIELKKRLKQLSHDQGLVTQLGKNAYNYFTEKCSLQNMVSGFLKAIDYDQ